MVPWTRSTKLMEESIDNCWLIRFRNVSMREWRSCWWCCLWMGMLWSIGSCFSRAFRRNLMRVLVGLRLLRGSIRLLDLGAARGAIDFCSSLHSLSHSHNHNHSNRPCHILSYWPSLNLLPRFNQHLQARTCLSLNTRSNPSKEQTSSQPTTWTRWTSTKIKARKNLTTSKLHKLYTESTPK